MKYLLLTAFLLQLISCTKNNDITPDPVEPPEAEGVLLKNIIKIDTTLVAPNDTISRFVFEYDNAGRMIKITENAYIPATGMFNTPSYNFNFFYSGSDTIPSSMLENAIAYGTANLFRSRRFYSYNSQGRMLTDSVMDIGLNTNTTYYDSSVYSYRYQYPATGFSTTNYSFYPDSDTTNYGLQNQAWDVNNNIILADNFTTPNTKFSFEYDNHINPLYKCFPPGNPKVDGDYAYPFTVGINFLPQKNNLSKIFLNTYDGGGVLISSNLVTQSIFTYKLNGLPETVRNISTPASSSNKYKYLFVY